MKPSCSVFQMTCHVVSIHANGQSQSDQQLVGLVQAICVGATDHVLRRALCRMRSLRRHGVLLHHLLRQ